MAGCGAPLHFSGGGARRIAAAISACFDGRAWCWLRPTRAPRVRTTKHLGVKEFVCTTKHLGVEDFC